ncbi:MAG: Xaa-Pro aminopeptidase [Thiohalomonadales bacterium]
MEQSEFQQRRKRLMQLMGKDSIAIIPAAPQVFRNSDVEFPYRQHSDFYYLSGFNEPNAVLVLLPKRAKGDYILFCRERDPKMETWTGRIIGLDDARDQYGANEAYAIGSLDDVMPGLMENIQTVYYTVGLQPAYDQKIIDWMYQIRQKSRAGIGAPEALITLDKLLHNLRLFKSRAELACMKKAAKISAQAHIKAMQYCRPGRSEYQVQAHLEHHFQQHATPTAYGSIVGGGANACVLHYTENSMLLQAGDLLLIDAGCEYQYYAADITRTFPVNGRFNEAQKALYELVLAAQVAAIAKIKPGNRWNQPHDAAVRVLAKGLLKLGLLKGNLQTVIKNGDYRQFYMHKTGHWLGLDVHDVGDYKINRQWRVFEPGMVLTVEPGLYISAGNKKVARKWWDIGIRIEDDVVVTKNGCDVLTQDVPKTVFEIEALMLSAVQQSD